jgi:hypothetical protein
MILSLFLCGWEKHKMILSMMSTMKIQNGESSVVGFNEEWVIYLNE